MAAPAAVIDLTGDHELPEELQAAPRRQQRRRRTEVIELLESQGSDGGGDAGGGRWAGVAGSREQHQHQQQRQRQKQPSSLLIDLTDAINDGPENLPRPAKRPRALAAAREEQQVLQLHQDVQQPQRLEAHQQQQPEKASLPVQQLRQQKRQQQNEQQQQQDLAPTEQQCTICFEDISSLFMHTFGACKHAFCLPCLREYVSGKVGDRVYPIPCPLPDCKAPISAAECGLVLTPEEQVTLGKMEAEAAVGAGARLFCPNPKCSMFLVADDKRADQAIACPYCDCQLCANCGVAWHKGMTCQQYQAQPGALCSKEDQALLDLAEKEGMKRCPSCGTMVQRQSGCSYMSCRCGSAFCYSCGKAKAKGSSHQCDCKPYAEQWLRPPGGPQQAPAHAAAHAAAQAAAQARLQAFMQERQRARALRRQQQRGGGRDAAGAAAAAAAGYGGHGAAGPAAAAAAAAPPALHFFPFPGAVDPPPFPGAAPPILFPGQETLAAMGRALADLADTMRLGRRGLG